MKKQVHVFEYELPVTITPLEEGGYLARCEALQGCLAEGKTIEQVLSYVIDVARSIIDLREEEGLPIPLRILKKSDTKSAIHFSLPLIYQSHV